MRDDQKQKIKDHQKEYYKISYIEKKLAIKEQFIFSNYKRV